MAAHASTDCYVRSPGPKRCANRQDSRPERSVAFSRCMYCLDRATSARRGRSQESPGAWATTRSLSRKSRRAARQATGVSPRTVRAARWTEVTPCRGRPASTPGRRSRSRDRRRRSRPPRAKRPPPPSPASAIVRALASSCSYAPERPPTMSRIPANRSLKIFAPRIASPVTRPRYSAIGAALDGRGGRDQHRAWGPPASFGR